MLIRSQERIDATISKMEKVEKTTCKIKQLALVIE